MTASTKHSNIASDEHLQNSHGQRQGLKHGAMTSNALGFHDSKRHLPLKRACLATHLWPSSSLVEVQADLIETSHWHSKNIGNLEKGSILAWSFAMHCKRINPNSQHLISVSCCCCFLTQQELSHRLVALQRRLGPWLWQNQIAKQVHLRMTKSDITRSFVFCLTARQQTSCRYVESKAWYPWYLQVDKQPMAESNSILMLTVNPGRNNARLVGNGNLLKVQVGAKNRMFWFLICLSETDLQAW